mmetsp:Transcript_17047/g.19764  ORF Transcript_17047/g.19764 Transcript_17047/m.19764 type:complete len:162 (+) Transcript_17047:127-612(+)
MFKIYSYAFEPRILKQAYPLLYSRTAASIYMETYSLPSEQDWCCILDGGYKSACITCPYPDDVTKLIRNKQRKSRFQNREKHDRSFYNESRKTFRLSFVEESEYRDILGIPDTEVLSERKIKTAFRVSAQEVHPDKVNGSEAKFLQLVHAYEKLMEVINNS